ncbi:uncharacterized protein LOC114828302 [Galendromus occidentalis]|uniref:Uncharacterized protein LOC114828302 n=1 Tax=Galendromus occidentalis TaxID=34638 RepID=A0AAJ7SFH8_9ACAR|nr:uncharacterized protein LOC114828302 [Galendromus occidentalis]
MGVTRIVEVVRDCPWVKPLFLRVALSIIILLYIITGAAIFVVIMAPPEREVPDQDKMARIRNDTSKLLVTELQLEDVERASQIVYKFLLTYEREIDRTRVMSPVDELFQNSHSAEALHRQYRGDNFENSLYFTLSLITATASGNLLRLPDATQFVVILYTAIGIPLLLVWICLMGRSMAQFWIMLCLHSCCCGMSLVERADVSIFRRLFNRISRKRCVTPEMMACGKRKVSTPSSSPISIIDDLVDSERNVLVQPENFDEYFRLVRGDLFMPVWTLSLFFLLYSIFGATFGAVTHDVSFMTAFFYGYLIFTTIGGITPNLGLTTSPMSHLTRFGGDDVFTFIIVQQDRAAKVIWMLYFLIGYMILSGIVYMVYLYLTWRCTFCRKSAEQSSGASSLDMRRNSDKSLTPVEVIPSRRASTPGHVLMGKKMVESRRSSAITLQQTTIEMTTPEIEEELRTLAEEDEETKSNSSDSGISKTGSERMVEEDRQTVRSVRSGKGSSGKSSTKSGGAISVRSKLSAGRQHDSIEEDIRDEEEPEGMMEIDDDKDPDDQKNGDSVKEGGHEDNEGSDAPAEARHQTDEVPGKDQDS